MKGREGGREGGKGREKGDREGGKEGGERRDEEGGKQGSGRGKSDGGGGLISENLHFVPCVADFSSYVFTEVQLIGHKAGMMIV